METTILGLGFRVGIMENQMGNKKENEMGTREYIGNNRYIRVILG